MTKSCWPRLAPSGPCGGLDRRAKAIEEVEDRLFGDVARNGPKLGLS
jgi:hypothetical protein